MPIRFTSPSLGGQSGVYLAPHEWQIGVAYRRLTADEWYVGRVVDENKAPFKQPLFLNINSIDATASYGVTERFSVSLTLPFSRGTHSRLYADGVRHQVRAAGLGDVNLVATTWLFKPSTHPAGNVALGIGVKTPTGKNDVTDTYFLPNGTTQFTLDQSIQLGDGGWGIMLEVQGFRQLFRRSYGYASGAYLVSPRDQTDVIQGQSGPYAASHVSVPDVFNARAGVSYDLVKNGRLSASFGGRIDGIPMHDLIGGSNGFRRPAIIGYLEPGVTVGSGKGAVVISVPWAVYANFRASPLDVQLKQFGGGDLADHLIFAGYQIRF